MATLNVRKNIDHRRLMVAVHVIAWLAKSECLMTSSSISILVNAHSVVVRRIMQALTNAGIVESKIGRDGGYFLRVPADKITLGDVYAEAVIVDVSRYFQGVSIRTNNDIFLYSSSKSFELLK